MACISLCNDKHWEVNYEKESFDSEEEGNQFALFLSPLLDFRFFEYQHIKGNLNI